MILQQYDCTISAHGFKKDNSIFLCNWNLFTLFIGFFPDHYCISGSHFIYFFLQSVPIINTVRWPNISSCSRHNIMLLSSSLLMAGAGRWFSYGITVSFTNTNYRRYVQSSRWAPVLRPKTSKTVFITVHFSVYENKFKNLIRTSKFKFSIRGLLSGADPGFVVRGGGE